jgi:hypothetical protein
MPQSSSTACEAATHWGNHTQAMIAVLRSRELPLFRRNSGLHQCVSAAQTRQKTINWPHWSSWPAGLAPFWPHEITGAVEAAWCAVTVAKVVTKAVSTRNDLRIRETC